MPLNKLIIGRQQTLLSYNKFAYGTDAVSTPQLIPAIRVSLPCSYTDLEISIGCGARRTAVKTGTLRCLRQAGVRLPAPERLGWFFPSHSPSQSLADYAHPITVLSGARMLETLVMIPCLTYRVDPTSIFVRVCAELFL
jgi:hypothetical protein